MITLTGRFNAISSCTRAADVRASNIANFKDKSWSDNLSIGPISWRKTTTLPTDQVVEILGLGSRNSKCLSWIAILWVDFQLIGHQLGHETGEFIVCKLRRLFGMPDFFLGTGKWETIDYPSQELKIDIYSFQNTSQSRSSKGLRTAHPWCQEDIAHPECRR